MLLSQTMPEALRITIRYSGSQVDDGTMPVDDVMDALQGFSGAYGKISSRLDPERHHQLKLAAVQTGSFELAVLAWAMMAQAAGTLETLQVLTDSARWVVSKITEIITVKKHTKAEPYTFNVRGDNNTVVVVNAEGAELAIPPDAFELFKSKLIDSDLHKITTPLRPEQIESAEIRAGEEGDILEASISSEERGYFLPPESTVTSRETEIIGRLVSVNKENNRGTFRLGNGKSVRYRYAGNNPHQFHVDFSHQGTVRVRCIAEFDENLEPTHLEISSVEHLQERFPFEAN